jgi:AmmeMemoRadiSam system protein B/AmmeMemoRadiSam system protein A
MPRRLFSRSLALGLIAAALTLAPHCSRSAEKPKVRQPGVAGAFYPADAKQLARMIDQFLAQAKAPEIKEPIVGIVSPHAGYVYSGPVAAYSYALIKGMKPARVVVIAPSHFDNFPFSSVYNGDAYATPLGQIPVDKDFAARLAKMSPLIKLSDQGHAPLPAAVAAQVHEGGEHSLEVQLPFLQRVLGPFKLVPIVMGDQNYEIERALGVALAKMGIGGETLIVASSDLSHYHPYEQAVSLDHKTLKAIEEGDYLGLSRNFEARVWEACGGGPIVAAMIAAERLGGGSPGQAHVIHYANSGDTTGERDRVVGYGSVALVKQAAPQGGTARQPDFALSPQEKLELLRIARASVETAVRQRKLYEYTPGGSDTLAQERGAFVTLKEKGELRGCIGYSSAIKPLALTVRDVAAMAAVKDTRFPPVAPSELGQLEYEISVLSPLHRVPDVKQIQVGRDGLVVKRGAYEGLLLPQVPVEQHWERAAFLEQTCRKAGLPPRAWQDEATDVFWFTAVVFDEHSVARK